MVIPAPHAPVDTTKTTAIKRDLVVGYEGYKERLTIGHGTAWIGAAYGLRRWELVRPPQDGKALGVKKSSPLVTVGHFHHFVQTWNGKVLDF
jgi:hypothetical protein